MKGLVRIPQGPADGITTYKKRRLKYHIKFYDRFS